MSGSNVFDIVVIGGGIVGMGIAYELSKRKVSVALIERKSQVTQGASKGNSGILHAGYDSPEGSLRAKLVTIGNRRYDDWSRELGLTVRRMGSLVVAFEDEGDAGMEHLNRLKERGERRGIPLEILGRKALLESEPNLNRKAVAALHAPTAGSICPMRYVNFMFKHFVANGGTPFLDTEVTGFVKNGGRITEIRTNRGDIIGEVVINAAGVFGDVVSSMAGIDRYRIYPRKGEYILLEPHPSYNVNKILFPLPTEKGKGILVIPTETGDILLGPTSYSMGKEFKEDTTTSLYGLNEVLEKARKLVPGLSTKLTVKTFAGNRAQSNTNDFAIEGYDEPSNFINAIGIRSPGLTAAPAIADMVVGLVEEKAGKLEMRSDFRYMPHVSHNQPEEALSEIRWADTITPNLDSPSIPLIDIAWNFGIRDNLYNFSCYTNRGLGVDLGTTFQNELIRQLARRGMKVEEILYRLRGSNQVISEAS